MVNAGQFNHLDDVRKQVRNSNTCPAKKALAFYATSISGKYQWPVAILFLNNTTASIQAAVVKRVRDEMLKRGAFIRLISTDGFSSNLTMFKELGCRLNANADDFIATKLNHPNAPPVRCTLEPIHCLKLLRNQWGDKGSAEFTVSGHYYQAHWEHIVLLNSYEVENETTYSSIRPSHIDYKSHPMKVSLAMQVFGRKTAAALIMYADTKNEIATPLTVGTRKLIELVGSWIDRCNQKSSKTTTEERKPVSMKTIDSMKRDMKLMIELMRTIRFKGDQHLAIDGRRHAGVLGSIMSSTVIPIICEELLAGPFQYVPTFYCTSDPIENFFSLMRIFNGNAINPTKDQVLSAIRHVLMTRAFEGRTEGSVLDQGHENTLTIFDISKTKGLINYECAGEINEDNIENEDFIAKQIGLHQKCISGYVAGHTQKFILKNRLKCQSCKESITSDIYEDQAFSRLIDLRQFKNCHLSLPSNVVKEITDMVFAYLQTKKEMIMTSYNPLDVLVSADFLNTLKTKRNDLLASLCELQNEIDDRPHNEMLLQVIAQTSGKTFLKHYFKLLFPNEKQTTIQKKLYQFRSQ